MILNTLVLIAAFVLMEAVAWLTHKYIMHGFLWSLHKDHHQPKNGIEKNDLFGIFFAAVAIVCIKIGFEELNYFFWAGLGITAYGFAYFLFHDVIVHRRINWPFKSESPYLKKIIRAHKIHHKNTGKEGGQFFGFLFVKGKDKV